jgi:hypothetical protein
MLFLGEFPVLGPNTKVQELSGYAGAPAGNPVLNAFKPGTREVISVPLVAAATFSQYIFQAPWLCQVVGIRVNFTVQSTGAANMSIERIIGDTVAPGATNGTTIILLTNAVVTLQGTANTRQNVALSVAAGSPLVLNAGDQIALFNAATSAGLVGGYVQIEIAQIG